MLPVVVRATEESLRLVPESLRQASYALGATQAQTVIRVLIPAALPAITTGVLLAMGIHPELARGSLRLTLGRDTTAAEIERTIEVVGACLARLRSSTPVAAAHA